MSVAKAPDSALFSAEGTSAAPDRPALLGGRCIACGSVFFPMQTYGCEQCGSQALEAVRLTGRGQLVASAEVHVAAGPHRPAPFTVGSVVTEEGAVVRALLDVAPGAQLTPGEPMVTRLVAETRQGRGTHDLRFVPVSAG